MNQFDFKQYYRRGLPHVQQPGATLFVTFRLDGSIPHSVMEDWLREKKALESEQLRSEAVSESLSTGAEPDQKVFFQRRWFAKFEVLLHANVCGPIWLKEAPVAEIVREALHHRDSRVYRLDVFSIMPNHVHVVFAPLLTEAQARQLAERAWRRKKDRNQLGTDRAEAPLRDDDKTSVLAVIMQSLKGYTARKCNPALGREGAFWQHESFDRVIRDEQEFARIINYVLNNPVKARLVGDWRDWEWNYCAASLVEAGLAG